MKFKKLLTLTVISITLLSLITIVSAEDYKTVDFEEEINPCGITLDMPSNIFVCGQEGSFNRYTDADNNILVYYNNGSYNNLDELVSAFESTTNMKKTNQSDKYVGFENSEYKAVGTIENGVSVVIIAPTEETASKIIETLKIKN